MSTLLVEPPSSVYVSPQVAAPVQLTLPFEESSPESPREAEVGQQATAVVESPSQDARRLGKTVKIGGVMLQLLRSYGITDQEIAEGIERYELKMNAGIAS